MFSSGPKYQKLTTNLRLAINRLKLLEKKKTEQAVKSRKEIADFLSVSKIDRARIRVEHIVREDYLVEAMELVEMYCDLLLARMGLIQSTKELDPGLEEPIASVLWAAPRLQADCQELKAVSDQLIAKYGKEFGQGCQSNSLNIVNEKLMHKLSVQAPPKLLVEKYLEEIAKTYNIPYTPDHSDHPVDILAAEGLLLDFNNGNNNGGGGNNGGLTEKPPNPNMPFAYPPPKSQSHNAMPFTTNQHPYPPDYHEVSQPPHVAPGTSSMPQPSHPANQFPGKQDSLPKLPDVPDLPAVPGGSMPGETSAGGNDVDFDDLTKRFEELKRKK